MALGVDVLESKEMRPIGSELNILDRDGICVRPEPGPSFIEGTASVDGKAVEEIDSEAVIESGDGFGGASSKDSRSRLRLAPADRGNVDAVAAGDSDDEDEGGKNESWAAGMRRMVRDVPALFAFGLLSAFTGDVASDVSADWASMCNKYSSLPLVDLSKGM